MRTGPHMAWHVYMRTDTLWLVPRQQDMCDTSALRCWASNPTHHVKTPVSLNLVIATHHNPTKTLIPT
jgi:hypothetical protein